MSKSPAHFRSPARSTCFSNSEAGTEELARTACCCCSALTVETESEPVVVVVCHCLECQRRTGSAFGASAFFEANGVRISGPSRVYARVSDEGRRLAFRFCPACGSTVCWETERHPGRIAIALGAFASPDFPGPARSVFERSRHRWVKLPPGIPAHIAGRDSALIEEQAANTSAS